MIFFTFSLYLDETNEQNETTNATEGVKESTDDRPVYFLSLVGTDAGDRYGKGIPRSANYFYDIRSNMELRQHGITFMSAQDLQTFHHEHSGILNVDKNKQLNIYQLVHFFMQHHPDGYYFLDEVPLIKSLTGKSYMIISN